MITIGERVPERTLEALHEGEVREVDLRARGGRWLALLSYPADFTFICPTELAAFAEREEEFEALGADVMSVSTDTVFAHKAWHDSSELVGRVGFPMLADPTGALCRALGVYLEAEGVALRGTFIVDPDGIVRALELHDNSIGRDASETLRKLQAAQHVRERDGEVCPAGWPAGRSDAAAGAGAGRRAVGMAVTTVTHARTALALVLVAAMMASIRTDRPAKRAARRDTIVTSLKLVLIVAAAALLALPEAATARITVNTVEPTAEISKQGRRAEIGVLLGCDTVQRVRLRVTVTQRAEDRASVAQGRGGVRCTTEQERFPITAKARRQSRFEPGEATACVLALGADDARQWCKNITLE